MRHGKHIRERKEALGFTNPDTDESTHDMLDYLESAKVNGAALCFNLMASEKNREANELVKEINTLRAALQKYGRHFADCEETDDPCFCGLKELIG